MTQRQMVGYRDGLASRCCGMARLQSETAAELGALLPSILDKASKGELLGKDEGRRMTADKESAQR
jgi:hypothetical protein